MIIKKFQAKTETEAVENAKKELGQNIVIMNVKAVKPKGLFRIFKKGTVEVTVAKEEEAERTTEKEAVPEKAAPQEPPYTKGTRISDVIPAEALLSSEDRNEKVLEEKLDSLQNFLEKKLTREENPKENRDAEEGFEEEKKESVVFLQLLYSTMLENEVKEEYANQIIDEVEKIQKDNMPIDYVLSHVYQKMILKFGRTFGISPAKEGPKVLFFIGPTGVGKTTTIAKIASKFRVDEKKKVALLTADTYRIAAAEQLRTYASILDVPFRVIYSVEEMENAVRDFKDCDYILIDTAGHSHQNEVQRDNMNQFIHSMDEKAEKEVFLVVSATTKYKDLVSIADSYSTITEYKLIFTKLDETTTLGNLLNLKLYTGASISYITCGQNVPDDIERFNPQSTVKQILGGGKQ